MFNVLILAFVSLGICCPNLFSQATTEDRQAKKEAFKLDSFGRISSGDLRGRYDTFLAEISNAEKGTRGVFVVYGTIREVESRKLHFSNHVGFRNFDKTLITYIRGGNVSEFRTDFWIVPKGADGPKLEREAFIVGEIGKATKTKLVAMMRRVFLEISNNPSFQAYIINSGTNAEIARREKWLVGEIAFRHFDRSRITLVRGGRKSGPRTVVWMVPLGAANPAP